MSERPQIPVKLQPQLAKGDYVMTEWGVALVLSIVDSQPRDGHVIQLAIHDEAADSWEFPIVSRSRVLGGLRIPPKLRRLRALVWGEEAP